MKTSILAILGFLLIHAVASAAFLKKAEVTAVINDVKLLEANAGERGAKVKDVVQGETAVKTGAESRGELLFQDKTLTRLGANSLFSFTQGTRDLELEHGTMLLQCPKGVGGAKIRTAAVTAAITGTTIMIEYSPPKLPKHPPGYIPTIGEMTPEEALAELQHPRRNYTKAEHKALEDKAKRRKKGGSGGYVKVLVLEGTLRLYLNNQVGESVLITAGHMIITSPNTDIIPPPIAFDVAGLVKTSLLINGWGGGVAGDLSTALVAREVANQDNLKSLGDLLPTNLIIPGAGTEVFTLAQIQQSTQVHQIAVLAAQSGSSGTPGNSGASGPTPPQTNPTSSPTGNSGSSSGTPVGTVLPGFFVEGSTTIVQAGDPPPPTSASIPGNFSTVQSLPGAVTVFPSVGTEFSVFSNAGSVPGGPDRTATKVYSNLAFPTPSSGTHEALSFDYRFFSNEVNQGPSYPDQFTVTIASGSQSIELELDRNALSPNGTGILTPVGQAGVAGFLGGTDWLPFTIDITPFAGASGTVTYLVWDVGDAIVDSAFAVDNFNTGTYPAATSPSIPGRLTLNFDSLTLGNGPGEYVIPNLEGLPARDNAGPAASAGMFVVNTVNDLTLNAPLDASTGANGAGTTFGGTGGTVQFTSANGQIAINSTIQVSESSTSAGKASAAGGSITLTTNKTTGPGITVSNSGQLLALLNATAPGPGGTVQLISAGGDITVGGKIQADRGTIDVHNNGASGQVFINSTAQLSADVIKAGALGPNGQLTISAGSQINANTMLKLYGGTGASGMVLFTGAGNVNISGNQIHIAATTVQVGASTHVNNSGSTFVHATNHNYGIGAGGGNFQNPVTAGSLTGAPAY